MQLNRKGGLIEMLFFDRRKGKERRSAKDRREVEDPDYKGLERRSPRKRRSGRYHRLPEDQKNAVGAILANLEKLVDWKRE